MKPAPTLVFGWGNPSRGDDALGPLFVQAAEALNRPDVECLTDFQLQVEHALDLRGRQRVLFVDAADGTHWAHAAGFSVTPVYAAKDASITTHAVSPQAVLQVLADLEGQGGTLPETWLLAMAGQQWGLGEGVSECAQNSLAQALTWAQDWL